MTRGFHAPRFALFEVQGVEPGAGTVGGRRQVQQRSLFEQHGKTDARIMLRESLRRSPTGGDPPQVHFVRREPTHEIDVLSVVRPEREMAVNAWRCDVDLPAAALVIGRHDEQRIAGRGRVVDDPFAVRRPVELRNPLNVAAQAAADDRYGPAVIDDLAHGVGRLGPDAHLGPARRELQHPNGGVAQLRDPALSEVLEVAGADLTQPHVPGAVAVRDESDKASVA
jgi:hypothetical protein